MRTRQSQPRRKLREQSVIARHKIFRRSLQLELLEPRCLLSASPPDSYLRVTADWFTALSTTSSNGANSWIVRLTPEAVSTASTVAAAAQLLEQNAVPVQVLRGLGLPGQLLVSSTASTADVTAALSSSALVASFQYDVTLQGAVFPNDPLTWPQATSDPYQSALYNPDNVGDIDADLAWDVFVNDGLTVGSSSVVVAVIDSGIDYTHPDLAANIWTNTVEQNGTAGVDDDNNGYIDDVHGYDFKNRDGNPMDDQGHGTHIAGTIGAKGNNSLGVTGVNWATSMMPLKFLDENNVGSVAHAVEAINYATMMRTRTVNPVNIRVINASWGGSGVDDSQLKAAIQAAGAAGILFVSAAGNGDVFGRGQNIDELPFFPASFDLTNTIVVAATDRNDQLTNFSNYGTNTVDIAAPGLSVLSTKLFIDENTVVQGYGTQSGTSMAVPHVAGTAALIWATAPNATVTEVRDAILNGANSIANLTGKVAGSRRLNAYGALLALPPQAVVTSAPNITSPGGTPYEFTVELSSNVQINGSSIGTGDFILRRQGGGNDLTNVTVVSSTPSNNNKKYTVTYQVLPPDSLWDVFDVGTYDIELQAGQVLDVNNVPSRSKVITMFQVDFSTVGVFRPDVETDGADANPGDGLAKTPANVTTLRAAIQEANLVNLTQIPGGGTIILKPGTYTLAIAGAGEDAALTGDLDITGKVKIASDGTGEVTIVTGSSDRVFDVRPGGTLDLTGVKLVQQAVTPLVAPIVTAGADVTIQTGTTYATKGIVADSDSTSFTATVNYGEGAGAQALTISPDKTFTLSNLYETAGTYSVTVAIRDEVGQVDSQSFMVVAKNSGEVVFTPSATLTPTHYGESIAAGDLTGDGFVDIVTADGSTGNLSVYVGNGDGTYKPPTTIPGFSAACDDLTIADLNHDGKLDVIVPRGGGVSGGVWILLGLGNGTFQSPVFYDTGGGDWFAIGVAVGDFDGDSHDDLAVANYGVWPNGAGSVKLLWGVGDGTFVSGPKYTLQRSTMDVVAGNIDADPALELLATTAFNYSVNVLDYIGNRQFQFGTSITVRPGSPAAPPSPEAFYASALIDLNGDSKIDFAVVDAVANLLHVLIGNGDGTFQTAVDYATGSQPQELVAGDVNGDGHRDLVVANAGVGTLRIFLNQGNGTLNPQPDINAGLYARDTLLQDLDGNGSRDLAVIQEGSYQAKVFLNQGLHGNPHLSLATPDSIRSGQAFPTVLTVRDSAGNVRTDFTGAVRFKSSVAGAQLPADYTFTPGDAGSHTFMLTRSVAGTEKLTVQLASDPTRFDVATIVLPTNSSPNELFGGGLHNAGTTNVSRVEISGFEATKGGGIYNVAGTLTLTDSTIAGNTAIQGGGIWNAPGATVTVTGSTINDNEANGPFTSLFNPRVEYDPNPGGTYEVTPADVDGDGDIDMLTGNYDNNSVTIFKNNGQGAFTPTVITGLSGGPTHATLHPDLTGDSIPDIVVGFETSGELRILPGLGNGNFSGSSQPFVSINPGVNRLRLADLNNDGLQDFVVADWNNATGVSVVLVQPSGPPIVKTYAVGSNTSDVAVGYLNNDAYLDVIAGNVYSQDLAVLLGNGTGPGNFSLSASATIAEGDYASSVLLRDFNRDGKLDLAIPKYTLGSVGIRLGNGNGTFQGEINYPVSAGINNFASGDLNRDEFLDIVVGNVSNGSVNVLFGKGDGTFGTATVFSGGTIAAYVAIADFNNDGWLDAATTNYIAGATNVLMNTAQYPPDGGGIYNAGTLTATNVTISGNEAAHHGAGVYNSSTATATIESSTLTNNHASADNNGIVSIFKAEGTPVDSVGVNNGVPSGSTTYAPGKIGQAFDFDASTGTRVVVPGLSSFQSQTFTVEAWVNADSVGSRNDAQGPVIVTKDGNGIDFGPSFFVFGPGNTSRFQFGVQFTDATQTYFQSSNTFAFGVWHHVALTWDGARLRGYVNGNLEGEAVVGGSKQINYFPAVPVTIGAHFPDIAGGGDRRFDGRIDEVTIHNYALSALDIQDSASLGSGGGIANSTNGIVNLRNSAIAANTSGIGGIGPDIRGVFASQGGNLISDVGAATGISQVSDQTGTLAAPLNPKLGPLADNGSLTKTHLPASDSPAIDAGVSSGAPSTDQRGVARPKDGDNNGTATIDIGAVERYHASISGKKFQDQNQNGIQDVGELGLAGWTFYLDANNNGQLDSNEQSTTTDANGNYTFKQLAPGSYKVAEVNQTGWTRTYTSTAFMQETLDISNGALGLDGASSIAATADGKFIYVAGTAEAKIQWFSRNSTTGQLTALGTTTTTELVGGFNILQNIAKLVVAPVATASGLFLYALTSNGALAVFSVNTTTGDLTLSDVVRNGDARGITVSRLVGSTGLAVSSDGSRIYVSNFSANALNGGTMLVFERIIGQFPELRLRRILNNGTGTPVAVGAGGRGVATYGNQVYVVGETADSLDTLATFTVAGSPSFLNYTSVLRNGENDSLGQAVSGLDGANDIAISSDGKFAYVSAATSGAVTVFARNAAGVLTFVESLAEGAADSSDNIVGGVQEASSVTISADGSRVYVTGRKYFDEYGFSIGAVSVFRRNAISGRLTYLHSPVDTIPDTFGAPIENIEYATDAYATGGFVYAISPGDEDAITVFRRDGEGLDSVTLLVGDDRTGMNFSAYAAPGEIHGTVFNDIIENGQSDPDENGKPGVVVYLDLDQDNVYDSGGANPEPFTTTDGNGSYVFENLAAPRSYSVRLNLQINQRITVPSVALGQEWTIDLDANENFGGADFRIHTDLTGDVQNNQISGKVWQDTNKNGIIDGSEFYLSGRQVYLDVNDNGAYNAGVDIPASQLTTVLGEYSFTNLGASDFFVRVIPNVGELTSTPIGNSFTKQTLATGANPLGLVTADFNGDTLPDFATVDGGTDKVSVRLQQAGGSFGARSEYTVGSQPTSIAVGKFNNDAFPDIAVVHWALSKVYFLVNSGNGTFTKSTYEISIASGYSTLVAADIDLDGDDDLAVAIDGTTDYLKILKNNGGANLSFSETSFALATNSGPLSLAAGDITADNLPEIVIGNFDSDKVQVFKNNGGGSFSQQLSKSVGDGPSSVAIAPDMTGDGKRDVVITSIGASTVSILPSLSSDPTGLGTATVMGVGQGPRSVAVADVDQDNDLDIIVGNTTTNDVVVLRNKGGNTFSYPESTGLASFASLAASGVKHVLATDINKDGIVDLAAVRGDSNTGSLAVLYNALAPGSIRLTIIGSDQQRTNQNFGMTTATYPLGDYDHNGSIGQSDYTYWRSHFGETAGVGLQADGNGNNIVDAADYVIWRNSMSAGSAAATTSSEGAASGAVVLLPSSPTQSAAAPQNIPLPTAAALPAPLEFSGSDAQADSTSDQNRATVAVDQAVTALAFDAWQLPAPGQTMGNRPTFAALRNSTIQDSAAHDELLALLLPSPLYNRAFDSDELDSLSAAFDEPELAVALTLEDDWSTDWESSDGLE